MDGNSRGGGAVRPQKARLATEMASPRDVQIQSWAAA